MRTRLEKGASPRPFLCLAVCLLLWAPLPASAADCSPPGKLHHAHVRYVIDGDTLILDSGRHVRIVGLNAPEVGHDGSRDQPFARAARQRLTRLLAATGEWVRWTAGPERHDHYGRTLAHVYVDGQDVSRALLEAGLAAVVAIPPNVRRSACYVAAERAARLAGRGLWAPDAHVVHDAARPNSEGFQIVRGRVTDVAVKRPGTLLTLDGRLNVWIPAADQRYFHRPLDTLAGSRVLVRGWQHDYHGRPEIVVHHPAALTVLEEAAPASRH
ncbi:MAG TPA: thermonuclease family protein [Gammaproteobacteria bacterium]|nr:thermonuclease family protein [Gammaproteobacteria bacterium]